MEPQLTAVIIDDHDVVADGVRSWCDNAIPPISLIDAQGRLINVWTGAGADADVVIFDLGLASDSPGYDELRRLLDIGRKVVVYTQEASSRTAIRCIDMGAMSYVTKHEGREHLIPAVRAAANDHPYTPPCLSGAMAVDTRPSRPRLTPQETAVLKAWFACPSKKLAGQRLSLSPKTVDSYIARVRVRYAAVGRNAPTKSALVARALEDGVVTLTDLSHEIR